MDAAAVAMALRRSDRYLLEFVEALSLCPFARRCRESGKLHRRVIDAGDALERHLREVEALPDGSVEVALLICPEATQDARAWEAAVADLRKHATKFHCVAFHPELSGDLSDAHRAVRVIRRSPDPTVQLVHVATLEAARKGREGGSRYVDAKNLAELLTLNAAACLSDAIADQNDATLQNLGPATVTTLLSEIRELESGDTIRITPEKNSS